jgi:hypothetical protein
MLILPAPELITPQKAREMLANNANNRKLTPTHVKFLADQMRAGQWQTTPDTIKIARSGRLLDGQHRLSAIAESGMAQELYLAIECDEELFTVLDTGKVRTAADVVGIDYPQNAAVMSAIARLIHLYQTNALVPSVTKTKKATNTDVLAICQTTDLAEASRKGCQYYHRNRQLSKAEYGFLVWALGSRHTDEAETFLDTFSRGVSLIEESPIWKLRRKLMQAKDDARFRLTTVERLALAIKAWNLYRTKKTCSILTYNPAKETFPQPI